MLIYGEWCRRAVCLIPFSPRQCCCDSTTKNKKIYNDGNKKRLLYYPYANSGKMITTGYKM